MRNTSKKDSSKRGRLVKLNDKLFFIVFSVLSIGQIFFIFANSLFNRQDSLAQSGKVREIMQKTLDNFTQPKGFTVELTQHFVRKLAHYTEYFILGILICLFFIALWNIVKKQGKISNNVFSRIEFSNLKCKSKFCIKFILFPFIFCVLIAICDESLQFVSGRAPMLVDVALDSFGSTCSIIIVVFVYWLIKKIK